MRPSRDDMFRQIRDALWPDVEQVRAEDLRPGDSLIMFDPSRAHEVLTLVVGVIPPKIRNNRVCIYMLWPPPMIGIIRYLFETNSARFRLRKCDGIIECNDGPARGMI